MTIASTITKAWIIVCFMTAPLVLPSLGAQHGFAIRAAVRVHGWRLRVRLCDSRTARAMSSKSRRAIAGRPTLRGASFYPPVAGILIPDRGTSRNGFVGELSVVHQSLDVDRSTLRRLDQHTHMLRRGSRTCRPDHEMLFCCSPIFRSCGYCSLRLTMRPSARRWVAMKEAKNKPPPRFGGNQAVSMLIVVVGTSPAFRDGQITRNGLFCYSGPIFGMLSDDCWSRQESPFSPLTAKYSQGLQRGLVSNRG
jgi:hypothetical protein